MDITVPDIGHFVDVPVIEVHVTAGDVVSAEDPLLTLESDKATLDVPASAAGTVSEVAVRVGDRVSAGDLCHPERSNHSAKRSSCAVEGSLAPRSQQCLLRAFSSRTRTPLTLPV